MLQRAESSGTLQALVRKVRGKAKEEDGAKELVDGMMVKDMAVQEEYKHWTARPTAPTIGRG